MTDERAGHTTGWADRRPPHFLEPSFGQRLVARLVDAVIVISVVTVLGVVAEGRARAAGGLVLAALYEIILVSRRGQTVGKMALGIRIVDRSTGSRPSVGQAVTRWLAVAAGSLVALVVPAVGTIAAVYTVVVLVPVLGPPLHLGLHDRAARTIVTSERRRRAFSPG